MREDEQRGIVGVLCLSCPTPPRPYMQGTRVNIDSSALDHQLCLLFVATPTQLAEALQRRKMHDEAHLTNDWEPLHKAQL